MEYYVNVSLMSKWGTVHHSSCGFMRRGSRDHPPKTWLGPFASVDDARIAARSIVGIETVSACRRCRPEWGSPHRAHPEVSPHIHGRSEGMVDPKALAAT